MRRVFDVVLAQMRKDADVAQRINAALTGEPGRRGGGRAPAVLDPLALWREDPEVLEDRLRRWTSSNSRTSCPTTASTRADSPSRGRRRIG
jgi:hypothetical protein